MAVAWGYKSMALSIHDLTRRSTRYEKSIYGLWFLSIHDLTRRSTGPEHREPGNRISFNSRPHKEVDSDEASYSIINLTFNSRPHKEVDSIKPSKTCLALSFQFTTSQGGRRPGICTLSRQERLSIHDLTRRSTRCSLDCKIIIFLSIHDLTRRSTGF